MKLKGRAVLVTRPFGQATGLIEKLEAVGAEPLPFSPILIEPSAEALAALPAQLAEADWVIPVSPSAIDLAAAALKAADLGRLRLACVGASSARRLSGLTGLPVLHPEGELSDSSALLALPELAELAGQRVLIVRGENGRNELQDGLAERGATVALAELYQRRDANLNWDNFDALAKGGKLAAALVTSGEIAERLFALAGPARAHTLQSLLYGVPHPRVAERLRALGARRIVTTPADDDALVAGLQTWSSDNTMSDIQSAAPVPSSDPIEPTPARRLATPANVALLASLLALGLTGWQFYQTRHMLNQARAQLAQRLAESGGASRELRGLTEQAMTVGRANEAKLARLEDQINVAAGQYATLNGMYQELTKSRADWLLAEVEHTVTVASQQLQLTGNVPAAIEALQGASDRLAQFDKPQLIGVKRALAADLETLKALPPVDTVGLTVKLDRLALEVDRLPLVIDQHRLAAQYSPAPLAPDAPWWQRLTHEITQNLGEMVRIRRMDKPEALLLSPEQTLFLRENLKLRLIDARLALLQRDSDALHADIEAARSYVLRYFDRDTAAAQDWLRDLSAFDKVPLDTRLPDLARSLRAVHDTQGG